MCDFGVSEYAMIAAAIAAAGGSYMQADAANEAADRQAAALNAAMEGQDLLSRKAEGKALENAEEYKMDNRAQRFEDTRQQAGESLVQSLIKSREQGGAPDQASGRVSESFSADRASKLADQFQKSVDNARLMGNMRGTQDMLGNEAIMNADYASQLNTIGRNARGSMDAAQPGILSAGKVNTGQVVAGSALQALGTSYLAGSLGKAFGGTTAGADVGNGVGNANLMSNSTTGLSANAGQGLNGSVSTSGLMNSGNGSMFKLGGYYG
jgi:hypothetical protein